MAVAVVKCVGLFVFFISFVSVCALCGMASCIMHDLGDMMGSNK